MIIENRDGIPAGDTENPHVVTAPREGIPEVVDTPEGLESAVQALSAGADPVACDVERAQGFRFGADPYLVQIRREDVGTFLIDAHALPDLTGLQGALGGLWILHAADQDLPNIRQVGLQPAALFDTEVAALLLGYDHIGLAAVCERTLGLSIVKDHQAADWSVRPLPRDWLRYAALDVELLTELYRDMARELHDLGRWEWAEEEFAYVLAKPAPAPKEDRWRKLPGASKLRSRSNMAVLRELFDTREAIAREIDLAPGRLVRNSALVRAATQPPRNRRALLSLSEFRSPVAREHTDAWLRAITRALNMTESELPPRHIRREEGSVPAVRQWARIDEAAFARLQRVREVVSGVAEGLALAPEVVLAPKAQRYLTWAPLEDPSRSVADQVAKRLEEAHVRSWQRELVEDRLVEALGS